MFYYRRRAAYGRFARERKVKQGAVTARRWGAVTAACLVLLFFANLALSETSILPGQAATQPGAIGKPPLHSSALVFSAPFLLSTNPDSGSLTIIDTRSHTVLHEVGVGQTPRSVALDPSRELAYVANQGSGSVAIVDYKKGIVIDEVPVGDRPSAILLHQNGRYLAVAETGDDAIRFLETASLATISRQPVGDRPYGLSFTPDQRHLLVTHLLNGRVSILPTLPYTKFMPLLAAGGTAAGVRPTLTRSTVPGNIDTWPNIAPAPAVIVNRSGTRAYLPQTMANGQGLNVQFDTSLFPKVSVLNLQNWQHETAEHISLPETDQPVGLPWAAALRDDDRELWVVNSASDDVSILDISEPARPRRLGHVSVGANPRAIAMNGNESLAYVSNSLDGTISVIDTGTLQVTATISATTLPLPPVLLRGKQLFYSSARPELARARWISCNSCHIEGQHDGRTWQLQVIPELAPQDTSSGSQATIPRNTTSLLGMIETYPLRWSAEWDESADSEFSIRFEQFGDGLIAGDMHATRGQPNQGRSYDLDCLAAYIDSLAVPARDHELNTAELRGKALFESPQTACLDCHPPPLYTDLQQHDVGTAAGPQEYYGPLIDTPSLRFLYDSAPYLHDGSATTMLEVLTLKNNSDQHGVTSTLSPDELQDLAAYLLTLPHE